MKDVVVGLVVAAIAAIPLGVMIWLAPGTSSEGDEHARDDNIGI